MVVTSLDAINGMSGSPVFYTENKEVYDLSDFFNNNDQLADCYVINLKSEKKPRLVINLKQHYSMEKYRNRLEEVLLPAFLFDVHCQPRVRYDYENIGKHEHMCGNCGYN